jgi:hypothetical protein
MTYFGASTKETIPVMATCNIAMIPVNPEPPDLSDPSDPYPPPGAVGTVFAITGF